MKHLFLIAALLFSGSAHGQAIKAPNNTAATVFLKGEASKKIPVYEEGSWTPTMVTSGTQYSTITYAIQTGSYVKSGRLVTFRGDVSWTATGSPTGQLRISGLPFVASATHNITVYSETLDYNAGAMYATGSTVGGQNYIALVTIHDAANSQSVDAGLNTGATARRIQVSGSYLTN